MRAIGPFVLALALAAPGTLAAEAAVVASGQRPFQIAATAALDELDDGEFVDAGALRARKDAIASARVVVSIGPLAGGSVARALSDDGRVVAVLTPRMMGLPSPRTIVIPLDPSPEDVIAVIRATLPEVQRIGVLVGAKGPSKSALRAAGDAQGVQVVASDPNASLGAALDDLLPSVEAIWVDRSARSVAHPEAMRLLLRRAEDAAVPVVGAKKAHVLAGALLAVVPDPRRHGEAAGQVARRLLRGEAVDEVKAPRGAVLLNGKQAARLGLKTPSSLRSRVQTLR
jgi:ABC-type uncharacterized transport system substrate-binding protein